MKYGIGRVPLKEFSFILFIIFLGLYTYNYGSNTVTSKNRSYLVKDTYDQNYFCVVYETISYIY